MNHVDKALELFQKAYQRQMSGKIDEAILLYQASIAACPTAEAHTFLGWAYSLQGNLDAAIEQCRVAIQLDPEFGNPYNDIGAYLIEQRNFDLAIPWLQRALQARRYASTHFPWFNLGRVYAANEHYNRAIECFEQALAIEPGYKRAEEAIVSTRRLIH
jgi:Tfp pilus assembly protein PilF